MNVNNVKLECTAVEPFQYPTDGKPEVAFVGRSNVGKSSLLNYLINRKALARVSSTPGKTRGINFYNIEDKLYFVDLPGYGYAKVSKKEQEFWGEMINKYFSQRNRLLKAVVLLLDIRHQPTELDEMMLNWVKESGLNLIIVATKADKITKIDMEKRIDDIKLGLGLKEEYNIISLSSEKRFGREELWSKIEEKL